MYDVSAIAREPLLLDPLRDAVAGEAPRYLRSAKIKLTARCNLRCVMCKYGRGWTPEELDGERFLGVLDELADLGCRKIHFSGGEVLVRPDFEALASRAARRGMKVTLTSNLTLLTKGRAKELMRSKISSISTSLDGSSAKLHEQIRGMPGSFKRTLQAMKYIARERERRGQRTRLRVNFVMMRQNYHCYPELIRVAHDAGATEVHPMPVDAKTDASLRLSKRMIREYNQDIAPRVKAVREELGLATHGSFVYPFGREKLAVVESAKGRYAGGYYDQHLCYAPYLHLFIAWDGNVYLCCMTNGRIDSLGNVASTSVAEIFRGEGFRAIRRQMEQTRLKACHACDMFLEENRALEQALAVSPAKTA